MTEPFLILHKVRGQPAFDIAERIECPECHKLGPEFCDGCEGAGFWWIIPTSGHRAYPFAANRLPVQKANGEFFVALKANVRFGSIPPDWPDHYPTKRSPDKPSIPASALLADLGLVEKERRRG